MAFPARGGRQLQDRLGWLLAPAAWVYATIAKSRRRRLSATAARLSCPVISIGNLTCGGTGKTPTVEMVVRDLFARNRRPAILSRGYGAYSDADDGDAPAHNDEFRVLAANLLDVPHIQGADRVASGKLAVNEGADALVLDDGFQHVRLDRDLDFVLIDALDPFGGGRVLPAGRLRESPTAIVHADLVGVTRADLVDAKDLDAIETKLKDFGMTAPLVHLATETKAWVPLEQGETSIPLADLSGKKVLAFCAIGNPRAFRQQLVGLDVDVVGWHPFLDHHVFSVAELENLAKLAERTGAEAIVMTQKDAVKLEDDATRAALGASPAYYLAIEQRVVRGVENYDRAIDAALGLAEQ